MANNNTEVTFEIMEHVGVIEARKDGWTKEVNIVSWNGADAKLDIRNWHPGREKCGKGITLTEDEAYALMDVLKEVFRKVRKKKDETQVYSRNEEKMIFQEAWSDFENSKRLVYRLGPLAVMFQFLTGVRVGELCALKFSDIDGDVLTVCRMLQRDTDKVVEHTKNHEDREILLPNAAMEIIEVSRSYQREHSYKGEYIFSTNDKPLVYREVNVLLKKYCERLEIPYRSSHKLRKTYISSLIDAGININTIRAYAGHADEKTTYYNYCFDRAPDAEKKRLLEKALAS